MDSELFDRKDDETYEEWENRVDALARGRKVLKKCDLCDRFIPSNEIAKEAITGTIYCFKCFKAQMSRK